MANAKDASLIADDKEYNELWDLIVDNNIATNDELELISEIDGWSVKTLRDVLYVRTGYRDAKQYKECELNEVNYGQIYGNFSGD